MVCKIGTINCINKAKHKHMNNEPYIVIPKKIIHTASITEKDKDGNSFTIDIDLKRVATACYCYLWSGMFSKLVLSLPHLIKWSGFQQNSRKGQTNDKFKDALLFLKRNRYISYKEDDISIIGFSEVSVNKEQYKYNDTEQQDIKYATLYLSEIKKIINYSCNKKDAFMNQATLLLLFSYIRLNIWVERNDMFFDSNYVFNTYLKEIAEDIGISEKTVSKGLQILKNDLKLIYYEQLANKKNENKKWHTGETLICNAYRVSMDNEITFKWNTAYINQVISNKKQELRNKNKTNNN